MPEDPIRVELLVALVSLMAKKAGAVAPGGSNCISFGMKATLSLSGQRRHRSVIFGYRRL